MAKKISFFILQQLFQFSQHFYEKGKVPDPVPYLWLTDPDADSGCPKTKD
jgi:hypothetical protein